MLIEVNSWKPSVRKIRMHPQPDWVPDAVYTEAVAAKRNYNEKWEFLVYQTSLDYNVSQQLAEEALLRGLIKEFYKMRVIYGDKIGIWFEDFMEMGDIFRKIKLPEYKAQLVDEGETIGTSNQSGS